MNRHTRFDLAIVGGGIVGAWCAHLAQRSSVRPSVVVLERSAVGSGATEHSGGHLHRHGLNAAMRTRAQLSTRRYARLRTELADLPITDCELVGICRRDHADRVLDGYWDDGVHVVDPPDRRIDDRIRELVLADDQVLIAGAMSGYGDPGTIARRMLLAVAARSSGHVWEGTIVAGLEHDEGAVTLTLADGRRVSASQVIWATGPWMVSPPTPAPVPVAPALRVKNVVALHVARPVRNDDRIIYLFDEDAYLMPRPDRGQWIFSFPCDEWDHEPGSSGVRIRAEDRQKGLEILGRYRPDWREACIGGRVFCDAYTSDGAPLVARSVVDGVVLAGGGSGYGFRLAPAIATEALLLLNIGAVA